MRSQTARSELLPLLTASEMREWEAAAFAGGTIGERVVLESAGRALASAVDQAFPNGRIVAAIGAGNNGGDAVVALRTLMAWGRDVAAFGDRRTATDPSLTHGWPIPFREGSPPHLDDADVLIDGLLGTGATGSPRLPQLELIRAMNSSGIPIVAVDGPSGVDLSSGRVESDAVRAALTVTFGAMKTGLLLYPGRGHAGRILLAEVGFPPDGEHGQAAVIHDGWAQSRLPTVAPDTHKGRQGIIGVVAGRHGFAGAAVMAGMGALRAGAGGIRLVSSEDNRILLQTSVPEALFIDREDETLLDRLSGVAAVLVGPGIGTDEGASELLARILQLNVPIVLDADAITLIATHPKMLSARKSGPVVMTPHPAELARLLGCATDEVLQDRLASAARAAVDQRAVILAKGAPSIVAQSGQRSLVGTSGHSGVATGGMGDTLGGVVAAFLAAGCEAYEAAALGLHFAGRAAELAGQGRGLLPRDVAEALPAALAGEGEQESQPPPFLHELPPPA